MSIKQLVHVTRELPGGGFVLVLNTGAEINPEAEAMLQALHSRSIGGIRSHLEVLRERGAEKFMSTYYVGYGHKSIGDCGSCTVFVEGVSMLVAKAIQDWPLYAGQEASTRYIDFANQPFLDPVGTTASKEVLEAMRAFYLRGVDEMIAALKERHPREPEEKESVYDKAIRARAFDIMRGFLPAGATTNVAWHSNLRQVADKLLELRHHPLDEVRAVATAIESAVLEAFPNSFTAKRYEATEVYNAAQAKRYYYTCSNPPDFEMTRNNVAYGLLREYRDEMELRPEKTELPKRMNECGTATFEFLLDFGSFRDVQRHRAVTQRMPLLVMNHGVHPWYLEQLTPSLHEQARVFFRWHTTTVGAFDASKELLQYYIPMGYALPNRLTGALPGLVYLIELRSTRFVHPTLRIRAQQMGKKLLKQFGDFGLILHFDETEDRFDTGRGKHDIVKKD